MESVEHENSEIQNFTPEKEVLRLLKIGLSGSTADLANVILNLYFKYDAGTYSLMYDPNEQIWYLWNPIDLLWNGYDKYKIHTQCFDYIIDLYLTLLNDSSDFSNQINTIVNLLNTESNRQCVWNQILEYASSPIKFNESNDDLVLNNGMIYNIITHKSRLRTIHDYHTSTLNHHIISDIFDIIPNDNSDESHKFVWKFLYQIMSENQDKVMVFLKMVGQLLFGGHQKILIISGKSSSEKTVVLTLITRLLRGYALYYNSEISIDEHIEILNKYQLICFDGEDIIPGHDLAILAAIKNILIITNNYNPVDYVDVSDITECISFQSVFVSNKCATNPAAVMNNNLGALKVYLSDYSIPNKLVQPQNMDVLLTMIVIAMRS